MGHRTRKLPGGIREGFTEEVTCVQGLPVGMRVKGMKALQVKERWGRGTYREW